MLTGFLMQAGNSQTLPEQLTDDNVMSFVKANNIESAADLIESLPPLHKRHVSLVFASRALNIELVSRTHPRVVSWGADARFILSWASHPDAPDQVEFLQHGAEQWDAGVIDFSGNEPELSRPEVCSTCRGAGIADLTGLEYAVNLEALDLGHNPVTGLWALGLLPRLTVLNLDGAVTDLSFLAGLVALERLSLRNNGLTNVSALAGLVNLRHLSLRGNAVSNVWPLAGLAQLEILDLRGNTLRDRAPLSGLVNLRHLDLSDNPADVGAAPTLDWNLAVPNIDKRQRE